ncbi:MAG: alkaline phosphatase family protein [Sphingobacteriales bacterium]|nr:MAG: alkaline phosphatase family protein [Sphingobacteriales bacterium]TAF80851.1 MAG: alkaline phosphatase family protein [Sphingobacteriales bacterium]
MKKLFTIALIVCFPLLLIAQLKSLKKTTLTSQKQLVQPKLVVGIVVDQMRWDFLYRYANRYSQGGFKRLLREGFSCDNTQISYIPTVTAAGHTGIYTGSVPALHGITGNDWTEQNTGKMQYCTQDSSVNTVGSTSDAGQMSPRNLWATTITDELKLATNFKAKTIGLALKDRGAILPAGHTANAAYWFDDVASNWITSTYYMPQLPAWVNSFNTEKNVQKYIAKNWYPMYPIATYTQSEPDSNTHEGVLKNEKLPVFPHLISKINGAGAIRNTPYGNSITFDFAKKTITEEKMGANVVTDFLAISLSSTDYIGHWYGPNSAEIEDTYLRLDKEIELFLVFLDTQLGKNNYTVFLTADHGAAHNPAFLTQHHIPAGLFAGADILQQLNATLKTQFGVDKLVLNLANYQVSFNNAAIVQAKINIDALKASCINFLQLQNGLAYALDMDKISQASIPDALKQKIINGYNPQRSGAIQIILQPAYFNGYGLTGTTHGTWNPYDTHIPLLFMGWGIKQGSLKTATSMADIAPTLAALLHLQEPNASIGKPIVEMIKTEK